MDVWMDWTVEKKDGLMDGERIELIAKVRLEMLFLYEKLKP